MLTEHNHSNIRIAVDILAVNRASAGSFTVLIGLMHELAKLCNYRFTFYAVTKDVEEVLGQQGERFEYIYSPFWAKKLINRCLWQQLVLPRLAKKAGCALIYSVSGYPEIFTTLPVVSHQQNLWSFARPGAWWNFKNRVKSLLRRQVAKMALRQAKANVFISNFLRECANQMVPETSTKNFTVHNAVPSINTSSGTSIQESWAEENFCLAVGSFTIQKNYLALVRAFRVVANQCADLRLVIVGDCTNKYGKKLKRLCEELKVTDRIILTGVLELGKIISLYQKAKFSANVSLLEGFGLPVLESMQAGCPVICSNLPAFREIGCDAVLYCDQTKPEDIAEKMLALYSSKNERVRLSSLGLEQAKNFTWSDSAKKLLDIFNLALEREK